MLSSRNLKHVFRISLSWGAHIIDELPQPEPTILSGMEASHGIEGFGAPPQRNWMRRTELSLWRRRQAVDWSIK